MQEEVELLPRRAGTPEHSNWGVFGDDDELGTLNFLTRAAVLRGAATIRSGERYPINLPLNEPSKPDGMPIFKPDSAPYRKVTHRQNARLHDLISCDDNITVGTQASSQWDALAHAGTEEPGVDGVYYNGVGLDNFDDQGRARRNGIDKVAQIGIVGRGVLLDIARMVTKSPTQPLSRDYVISTDDTLTCMKLQGLRFEHGDIVCYRTGWTEEYLDSDAAGKAAFAKPAREGGLPGGAGIDPDHAVLAKEHRWAAVVADNPGVEVIPFKSGRESAHVRMLRDLGLTFGELFLFRDLAAACAADRRWAFLFVGVPMWIPGGVGSPANAIAIR